MSPTGQGLYLFCFARLSHLQPLPLQEAGWDKDNPVAVTSFQDLAAIWSPVPIADFSGPKAEERLQDLTWLLSRVIRHQEVVAGIMQRSPVLPARFGTIFANATNLEKLLQHHHDTIADFLERLTDRGEWAVKGRLDRSRAKKHIFSRQLAQEAQTLEALSPGKRYFQERRLQAACNQELQQWLGNICRSLWTDLRQYAVEFRERQLLCREATGSDTEMVWNWAFLVPDQAAPDFQACIREANACYADYGLLLECTGPWPPYSFTPPLDLGSEP